MKETSQETREKLSRSMKASHARRKAQGLPHTASHAYRSQQQNRLANEANEIGDFAVQLAQFIESRVDAALKKRFTGE